MSGDGMRKERRSMKNEVNMIERRDLIPKRGQVIY